MNVLIVKLNAAGDVVRTTSLLRRLEGHVTWITARENLLLLSDLLPGLRCLTWEDREVAQDRFYNLVINLEDEMETAQFATGLNCDRRFGALLTDQGRLSYTDDSSPWFDLSLISVYGRAQADKLKLQNRRSYQELLFESLGMAFDGEQYLLPISVSTALRGDVAIAPVAGPVWPMKGWDYYGQLQERIEAAGLIVNVLPRRATILEHLGDLQQHRCLVGGDSLPMHLALGSGVHCVTLFNCTSPWEIYDYGIQTKIISPLLDRFFYQRGVNAEATAAISLDDVYNATMKALDAPAPSLLTTG